MVPTSLMGSKLIIRFICGVSKRVACYANQITVIHTRLLCTPSSPSLNSPTPFTILIQASPQNSLQYSSNQHPLFKPGRHPRRRPLQIHVLNPRFPLTRLPNQIPKILSRDLALSLDFNPLFPLLPQLLDRLLQASTQAFGGVAEDFADFGGDAGGVNVGVVEGGEGGGDAAGEAGREGVRD